ncbi:glycosyltransferase family 4 protein [Sphingobacterium phlebotomi]|nr:glycosyltransferase family 4 protein [Sphingobacterium phlebotomi]
MELAKICDFELVSPAKIWRKQTFSKNLSSYDVNGKEIRHRKLIQLYPNDTFFLRTIGGSKNRVIYCRQVVVADFFLKRNFSVLLEIHSLPIEEDFKFLKDTFVNSRFVGLIVITEALKEDIVQVVGAEYKYAIHVLPDAADVDRFHYNVASPEKEELTAGYIGSNFPGKGWEIIEKLPQKTETKFHIYGFSNDSNASPNITFHGKVPFSKIPDALDSFDIGLLPNQPSVVVANQSEIGKYTSPMKLFEYMASGKVIVASDIPVIREVLKDGVNALLVPHDKPAAWIGAINRLNTDRDLFARLQRQAYRDVCSLYSYQARARQLVDIISAHKAQL